jgi:hypothetical protein
MKEVCPDTIESYCQMTRKARRPIKGKRKRPKRIGKGGSAASVGQTPDSGPKKSPSLLGSHRPLSSTEEAARLKAARMEKRIDDLLWRS